MDRINQIAQSVYGNREPLRIKEQFAETEDGKKTLGFVVPIAGTTVEIVYQWKELNDYGIWAAELSPELSQEKRMTFFGMAQSGVARHTLLPIPVLEEALERRFGEKPTITHMWIGTEKEGAERGDLWIDLLQHGQLQGQFFVQV